MLQDRHMDLEALAAAGLYDAAAPDADDPRPSRPGLAGLVGLEAALGLARVVGSSLARIGDAASTMVRGRLPGMSVAESGSELVTARTFAVVAAGVPDLGRALDIL